MGQAVLAKQLDNWQLLPRPQRFTELYFTDYRQLPTSATAGTAQKLSFTVHNLEHQTTTYHYKIIVAAANNSGQQVGDGAFTLADGQSQITKQTVGLPSLGNRLAVKVVLAYQGMSLGAATSSVQTQSIHYWLKVVNAPGAQ